MNFALKISPPFLRKLDAYLRINHSWIWTTRIHLHIYIALLLSVLFASLGLVYHISINDVPSVNDQNTFFGLLFIPATVFLIYMIYQMALFNTDKSAAYRFRYQEFSILLIYLFTFFLPLLIPYPASLILNGRISNLVSDNELQRDQNSFNEALIFLPVSNASFYYYYPSDSAYLDTRQSKTFRNEYYDAEEAVNTDDTTISTRRQWALLADSIYHHKGVFKNTRPKLYYRNTRIWSKNSLYGYNTYMTNDLTESTAESNLRDSLFLLYLDKINIVRDPNEASKHISQICELLYKYTHFEGGVLDQKTILNDFLKHSYSESYCNNYPFLYNKIYTSTDNITNIYRAKLRDDINAWDKNVLFVLFIFIFCITTIFQIYKNVHWKQVLLGAAILAILFTLICIIEVVSNFDGKFISFAGAFLSLLFLLTTIKGFFIKKFSWVLNQMAVILAFCLPYFPLIILAYLDQHHHIFTISYFDKYLEPFKSHDGTISWSYNKEYRELVTLIWISTFWGGILSYVFIWNSYMKTLFLRFWNLPKTK